MCRYPPNTIHRYLVLPSTQRIQTHTSHRHNTTPPFPTLVQAPYPLPTYTTHTTATKTQTHVKHSPCPHRIGKAQTQFSHTHVTHSTNTSHYTNLKHVTCTRQNYVYHSYTHSPQPHLPRTPHHHCRHPRTLTLSQHTHMQHKQQYMHHSYCNNRTHNIGYYDNLTNKPRTTTGLLTPHKHTDPAVKVRQISSHCKST